MGINYLDRIYTSLFDGWFELGELARTSIGDFVFYRLLIEFLREEINDFGSGLLGRSTQLVLLLAVMLFTLWIIIQGFRIVSGQSRDSMMALVMNSMRTMLIITAATTLGVAGSDANRVLTSGLQSEINMLVTGDDGSPEENIDRSLAYMQVGLSSINSLDVVGDPTLDAAKTRAMWFVGLGTGGPALAAGIMLLLYQIAISLFVGLGPIFILCLLFEQTKQLFHRWLMYGIGTMFSMALLSVMVSIALDMVLRVAAAFWSSAIAGELLGSNFTEGITSQAMQQGGMGLILTALIITVPPMAAMFFQGVLGSYVPYSQVGGGSSSQPGPAGQPPGWNSNGGHPMGTQTSPSELGGSLSTVRPITGGHEYRGSGSAASDVVKFKNE